MGVMGGIGSIASAGAHAMQNRILNRYFNKAKTLDKFLHGILPIFDKISP